MSTVNDIWIQALSLPPDQRHELAQELLRSLTEQPPATVENEQLAQEVLRRSEEYKTGKLQACDWRESVERCRQALKENKAP